MKLYRGSSLEKLAIGAVTFFVVVSTLLYFHPQFVNGRKMAVVIPHLRERVGADRRFPRVMIMSTTEHDRAVYVYGEVQEEYKSALDRLVAERVGDAQVVWNVRYYSPELWADYKRNFWRDDPDYQRPVAKVEILPSN